MDLIQADGPWGISLWTGSLFEERMKKHEEREGKGGEPIDKHLGSQHMTFTSFQNAAFSNEFFSLAGRLYAGGLSSNWAK